MNKVFVLHYSEDNDTYKMFSKHPSVLLDKINHWKNEEMSVSFDHVEEILYENVEELLQKINALEEQL